MPVAGLVTESNLKKLAKLEKAFDRIYGTLRRQTEDIQRQKARDGHIGSKGKKTKPPLWKQYKKSDGKDDFNPANYEIVQQTMRSGRYHGLASQMIHFMFAPDTRFRSGPNKIYKRSFLSHVVFSFPRSCRNKSS